MRTCIVARLGNWVMFRKLCLVTLAFVVMVGLPSVGRALAPSVTLTPSVASPQMLGTQVTWTAAVLNAPTGHTYGYQFRVTYSGQAQIVRDFSPTAVFTWVPHTVEGAYQVSVIVRDTTTTPYVLFAPVSVSFTLQPWVTAPLAAGAVNATPNSLVALFSGPPCATGHQMLVRFRPASSSTSMTTNMVPCSPQSANVLVAGMYPSTEYLMHWEEYNGTTLVNTGADLTFTTGPLPSAFPKPTFQVNVPPTAHDAAYPVVLWQFVASRFWSSATDLAGNVIWYSPNVLIARMDLGGNYYSYGPNGPFNGTGTVTEYDLAGNAVLQTNLEILNEQLVAKGYPVMTAFNGHEVRYLPNGSLLLLGQRDIVSTSAQGGTTANPVDIVGDMVLVLDHNLQLQWAWDSFAHEDINRVATLHDTCNSSLCAFQDNPSFTIANDWTHTNAAQGTADGNIILSQRSQDMVLKINYANGTGDGSVIWRMGAGLDFTILNPPSQTCGTPNVFPWFTHQHDPSFQFEDDASGGDFMLMTVFDDGNTRNAECPGTQNSRGIVLSVDEAARQVYIETSADLGGYSAFLGAAQLMTPEDGNIYANFDNPSVGTGYAQSTETDLSGDIIYQLQVNSDAYRAYRLQNLYTPTLPDAGSTDTTGGVLPPDQPFDFSSGFAQDQEALQFNGNASLSGNLLELTDGGTDEASSVFYGSPLSVLKFTTDFSFQLTNSAADGFTFTIQNAGLNALGSHGSGLGYKGVGESVAIKFDLHNNSGEGSNSTGLYVGGAAPTVPAISLPGTISLHSGDPMDAHITYDGTTLILTLTDLMTKATFSQPFTIDIPGTVGGSTAYFGFTGGTGQLSATQQILSWSYEPSAVPYVPTGFSSTGLSINGSASFSGSSLELTNGGLYEASSAYFATPVNIQTFNTDFNFKLTSPTADGFTFAIQNIGPTALGHDGDSLGYMGIGKSVAVKFDLYQNAGDVSNDSTGVFVDGVRPTGPTSVNLTDSGINLHSGDEMDANITYDGETLTLTITDMVTLATWSHPFVVDIPSTVGGSTAYVGFTAGTGSLSATQQILNWTFE